MNDTPVLKDLVLIGGGHSHVAVLKKFGMKPMAGVRVTLITREVYTPYSAMLPGFVAGHYNFDEIHIDLRPLANFAGARIYNDEAIGIDHDKKVVICRERPDVAFDVLSVNIGSSPYLDVKGASKFVRPVKPINSFVSKWQQLLARAKGKSGNLSIGCVGAGAGGVELLLAIHNRLREEIALEGGRPNQIKFHLFTDSHDILISHNSSSRARLNKILADRGIRVHKKSKVVGVKKGAVECENGDCFELDEILWVTAAAAPSWLQTDTKLALDDLGFISVENTLVSKSHSNIFAAGDIASVESYPRPKAGVFAVRQGPPLARNLRRALATKRLKPFKPQKNFLSLISAGDKYAIGSKWSITVEGNWVWSVKNWVDSRWMRKYKNLPAMKQIKEVDISEGLASAEAIKEISSIAMRCGGCGAKVGTDVLSRALQTIETVARPDILVGLKEPDDAAIVEVPPGKVMVHTVDFFRAFIDDPYVFGKVAANHALGDIYAMGAEVQSALAVASIPFGLEPKVEDSLFQLMSGASEVLREAGAALVGGHTSEASELGLGFSINGLIDKDKILRKSGMKPSDRLVLTKPLGTGTLFAADMLGEARGYWITEALDSMLNSNRVGAEILFASGASACTDITGFGLLGHLVEMVKASEVDVELYLNDLPLFDGALECSRRGLLSSLQPQNLRLRRAIRSNNLDIRQSDRFPLMFDPQTAGGLLASVPEAEAKGCIEALRQSGYCSAVIIGKVLPKSDHLEPITLS
ncbi:MAG: selenide, water dikinase SelD [Magnetovibrio sp.]|nr:selenide, water dikinase SelD [Magnetovibrio sp.]